MGCGSVATHNAIIAAGKSSSFDDVNNYLSKTNLLFGVAGAHFYNISIYLKKQGFDVKTHILFDVNIDELIKGSENQVGVLAYMHSEGGHYVAIEYDGSKFIMYNGPETELSSINDFVDNGRKYLCLITI